VVIKNANTKGISFLVMALLIISLQGIVVKWLGGDYPVLEMVVFRNLVALPFTLLFFRYEGKRGLPTTPQFRLEFIRGIFLFLSYTTAMMGLAALPLAEVEAIRFSGPMVITLLSVAMLREKVNLQRWLALIVGFLGVLFIVRPGSTAFNPGYIFVLISVLFYALTVMSTRRLKATDSSATMAFYSSLVYLAAAVIIAPLVIGVGEIPGAHPSVAFLFRRWAVPTLLDGSIMAGLGLVWAGWTYFMARAYSLAQASVAAPFEYLSLPINLMWGLLIFQEIPTLMMLLGAALTLLSGMYILVLDQKARQKAAV
jgi:drug/metabolite transporter (DMT)-like permease